MGGVLVCKNCLSQQSQNVPNSTYHYEAFNRRPFFGSVRDYQKIIKSNKLPEQKSNFYQSVGSPLTNRNSANLVEPLGPVIPPPPQKLFNPEDLVNLKPVQSLKGVPSIFDAVGDQTFVKKIKKSNYQQIFKSLQGTNKQYNDIDFPPTQKSIGKIPYLDISKVRWLRISDMIRKPVFVRDKIQPNDILQGVIGDCYFLSAMAALAEQDYRIKSIFPSLQINPNGIYMARVLHNGEYQQVVIDDYFPVNQNGQAVFAKPAGKNQIWVMILQKCWAKLYGSYQKIIGGLPDEALHAFSSAPVFLRNIYFQNLQKIETLWYDLIQYEKSGALLCCGSRNDDALQELGFVKGHAYTILGIYEKPTRLIKLRNPWGYKQWRGKASDFDIDFWKNVGPEDLYALDYQESKRNKDIDGVFFIVWQDFIKYFQIIDLCKINDNAHYNFLQSEFDHLTAKLFQFQIRGNQAIVTYGVTQTSKRGTDIDQYSRSYIALGKWDEITKSYKYVKSYSDKRMADVYLEVKSTTPGKYVLYVKYMWVNRTKNKAVVSIYSVSPAHIEEMKGQISPQNFMMQILFDHAQNNSKKISLNDKGDWLCSDLLLNQAGLSYFVLNVGQQSKCKYGVTLNEKEYIKNNLHLCSSLKGREIIKEEVSRSQPLVIFAELLSYAFPEKITNPKPEVVQLQ